MLRDHSHRWGGSLNPIKVSEAGKEIKEQLRGLTVPKASFFVAIEHRLQLGQIRMKF